MSATTPLTIDYAALDSWLVTLAPTEWAEAAPVALDAAQEDALDALLGSIMAETPGVVAASEPSPKWVALPQEYPKKCDALIDAHIDGKFVVQTEYPYRHFLVFRDEVHFAEYAESLPLEQRCFHEVMIGDTPRNLLLDIDATIPDDQYSAFFNELMLAFRDSMREYWGVEQAYSEDLIVVDSCGYSETKARNKFSVHIRYRAAATPREQAAFAKFFAAKLSRPETVDLGIYKKGQQARILGSTKLGDARHSRLVPIAGQEALDALSALQMSLVGYRPWVSYRPLPTRLAAPVPRAVSAVTINDVTINWILEQTTEHYVGYQPLRVHGARIYFKRVDPPQCDICRRQHDSDNALYFTIHPAYVTKSCMRDPTHHQVSILELPVAHQTPVAIENPPAAPSLTPAQRLANELAAPVKPSKLAHWGIPNARCVEYCEPKMRPYAEYAGASTVLVCAQKGVGKTEALFAMINECYAGGVIVAFSHRRTFAAELCRQLPGFVNYEDIKGGAIDPLVHNRIVVQIESLSRISLDQIYRHQASVDLLIMDESESIIEQLDSGLDRRAAHSWSTFNWLTQYSEHVIALDANMGPRTLQLFARREANSVGNNDLIIVRNNYQRAADTEYLFTIEPEQWRAHLMADLEEGLKLVIPINSATEANALHRDITERYPAKSVKLYTGETDAAVKTDDITNIDEVWSGCDVLIYTPTITSGVSYKGDTFDKVYAWFQHTSCSVRACDQMMGRVRSIRTKKAVVMIDHKSSEPRLSAREVRDAFLRGRRNLTARFAANLLSFEERPTGLVVHNMPYFDICVANRHEENKTRSNLMGEFIQLVKRTGAATTQLPEREVLKVAEEAHDASSKAVKCDKIARMVDTPDIKPAEFDRLNAKREKTAEESQLLARAFLRRTYGWEGEIDSHFVECYDNEKAKHWYRNLQRIKGATLGQIQAEDRAHYELNGAQITNHRHTYYYEHHRIAHAALRTMGFDGVGDKRIVKRADMLVRMKEDAGAWGAAFNDVRGTLGLRGKRPDFTDMTFKQTLEYLSSIVRTVYGVKAKARGRTEAKRDDFVLVHDHGFDAEYRPIGLGKIVPRMPAVCDTKECEVEEPAVSEEGLNMMWQLLSACG